LFFFKKIFSALAKAVAATAAAEESSTSTACGHVQSCTVCTQVKTQMAEYENTILQLKEDNMRLTALRLLSETPATARDTLFGSFFFCAYFYNPRRS
jgi:hypothetical protein